MKEYLAAIDAGTGGVRCVIFDVKGNVVSEDYRETLTLYTPDGHAEQDPVQLVEAALNAGEDLTGKVVSFTVSELIPDSAFGYNMTAGEHLNFCSESNPGAKAGDTVKVKVTKVASMFGSWIISYKKVK